MKQAKLELSKPEKASLKKAGIRMSDIGNYAEDELCVMLGISQQRARIIRALIEFQEIPSVGPKFAQDLVDMGYYSIAQLKDQDGAELLNSHEQLIGVATDPCVEDQFRLVVHYAQNLGSKKQWWDFTSERKAFRAKFGYPATRPRKSQV